MDRNAAAVESAARLLIVDGKGAAAHRWKDGLAEFRPEIVASLGEADGLRARDVVIVDLPELGDETLASLQASIARTPAMKLLTADHCELANILRTGVNGLFDHIVPRSGRAANVHALVERLRTPKHERERGDGGGDSSTEADVDDAVTWSSVVELLQWTVSEAVGVPGVIIRSYQPRSNMLEVQLVFRLRRAFERFHCELPRRWGWPARARAGELFTHVDGADPTVQSLGEIERDQEIYVRPIAGSKARAYLEILPWADRERITVVLGLWLEQCEVEQVKDAAASVISDLHAQAVRDVAQFTIPALGDATNGVRLLLDYNWAVTKNYAGPDRRSEDTPLINRHMFVGRRKTLPKSVEERAGGFVDGMPSWLGWYFVVYGALASIDTFCTSRLVSAGQVVELNLLLAPLITHHPWLFLLVKNLSALLAFAIAARFHRFPRAKWVLRACVGAYALLDLYWVTILLGLLDPLARSVGLAQNVGG